MKGAKKFLEAQFKIEQASKGKDTWKNF